MNNWSKKKNHMSYMNELLSVVLLLLFSHYLFCQPSEHNVTRVGNLNYFHQNIKSPIQIWIRKYFKTEMMAKLSCVYRTLLRSCPDFVRLPDFRVYLSIISCVHQTVMSSCSDFRAFMFNFSCVQIQIIYVHIQISVRSPDLRVIQTFAR